MLNLNKPTSPLLSIIAIIFISTLSFAQAVYRGNLNDNGDGTLGQENISFDKITTIYYNLKKHTK